MNTHEKELEAIDFILSLILLITGLANIISGAGFYGGLMIFMGLFFGIFLLIDYLKHRNNKIEKLED